MWFSSLSSSAWQRIPGLLLSAIFQGQCGNAWPYWTGFQAIWESFSQIYNLKGRLFYLLHVAAIPIYLSATNKPDNVKPTGVWARWKHINDRNKAWIDEFPTLAPFKSFVSGQPESGPGMAVGSTAESSGAK
jgi:hypothetical protein